MSGSIPNTRSYTLQAADAGLATDYHRRSHVLRIRAEGQQFLLAAGSLSIVIDWVDKLNAAIAVSLPVDDRREARYHTLPPTPTTKPTLAFAAVGDRMWRRLREDWWQSSKQRAWLMERQAYPEGQQPCPALPPGLGGPETASDEPSKKSRPMDHRTSWAASAACPCAHCWAPRPRAHYSPPMSTVQVLDWAYILSASRITQNPDEAATPRSSTSEPVGKWEPKPLVSTAQAKLDYARRCACALTYGAPWKGGWYVRDDQVVPVPDRAGTPEEHPHPSFLSDKHHARPTRRHPPVRLRIGDRVSGTVLSIRQRHQPIDTAVLLRIQLTRIGIELSFIFNVYDSIVEGIEVVQRHEKRVGRKNLCYQRHARDEWGCRGGGEGVFAEEAGTQDVEEYQGEESYAGKNPGNKERTK
ncbi:hypothetical protein LTR74_016035 [Friedmanniomyces endolithicus]|nr:hypothetical protein LTR74_016035 [Friedmanniomyces endolithicus]